MVSTWLSETEVDHKRYILSTFDKIEILHFLTEDLIKLSTDIKFINIEVKYKFYKVEFRFIFLADNMSLLLYWVTMSYISFLTPGRV